MIVVINHILKKKKHFIPLLFVVVPEKKTDSFPYDWEIIQPVRSAGSQGRGDRGKIKYLGMKISQPHPGKYNPTLEGEPHPEFKKCSTPQALNQSKIFQPPLSPGGGSELCNLCIMCIMFWCIYDVLVYACYILYLSFL